MREIYDDAGEEARFRKTEEESHDVELPGGVDESREYRERAPRDHDAGQPFPRAPPLDYDCARHLEEHVAEIKHGNAKSVNLVTESEVGLHAENRERDIHSIELRDNVQQEDEREDPRRDASSGALGE